MRYVLRCEPLSVGEARFGLAEFLMYYVDNATRFVSGNKAIRSASRIAAAIRRFEGWDAAPGEGEPEKLPFLALEEEDWTALRDELDAPKLLGEQPAFPISPARNCLRFVDAVMEAKAEEPKCAPPACATENAKAKPAKRKARAALPPDPKAS
jgi:hypothetical protein